MSIPEILVEHVPQAVPPHLLTADTWRRLDQLFAELDTLGRVDPASGPTLLHRPSVERYLRAHLPSALAEELLGNLAALPEKILVGDAPDLQHVRWSTLLARLGPFDPQPDLTYRRLGLDDASTAADVRPALERRFPGLPPAIFDAEVLRRLRDTIAGAASDAPQPRTTGRQFIQCVKRHLGLLAAIAVIALIVPILALLLAAPVGAAALFAALGIAANVAAVLIGCLLDPNVG